MLTAYIVVTIALAAYMCLAGVVSGEPLFATIALAFGGWGCFVLSGVMQ